MPLSPERLCKGGKKIQKEAEKSQSFLALSIAHQLTAEGSAAPTTPSTGVTCKGAALSPGWIQEPSVKERTRQRHNQTGHTT